MNFEHVIKGAPRRQQTFERHVFEKFQKAYSLPLGTFTHGDKPDVILSGVRKIGIEITRFYVERSSSASEQVQRQRRSDAVSEAQRVYERSTGNHFELTFSFDKEHPIEDSTVLVAKLVELGRRVQGGDNGQISGSVFEDIPELEFAHLYARELVYTPFADPDFPNGQPGTSEGFTAFATYRNRREARALGQGIYRPLQVATSWRVGQGHRFRIMSVERLKEIILEKEIKAEQYSSCDAQWLLIVVEFMDAAQEQEIRLDGGVIVPTCVFEKIIIYKPGFDHILEVTQCPQAAITSRNELEYK